MLCPCLRGAVTASATSIAHPSKEDEPIRSLRIALHATNPFVGGGGHHNTSSPYWYLSVLYCQGAPRSSPIGETDAASDKGNPGRCDLKGLNSLISTAQSALWTTAYTPFALRWYFCGVRGLPRTTPQRFHERFAQRSQTNTFESTHTHTHTHTHRHRHDSQISQIHCKRA